MTKMMPVVTWVRCKPMNVSSWIARRHDGGWTVLSVCLYRSIFHLGTLRAWIFFTRDIELKDLREDR